MKDVSGTGAMLIALATSLQALAVLQTLVQRWRTEREQVRFDELFDLFVWVILSVGVYMVFWDEIQGGQIVRAVVIAIVAFGVWMLFRMRADQTSGTQSESSGGPSRVDEEEPASS